MTITDAAALIRPAFSTEGAAEYWADLGCGSGVFTLALANCLHQGSKIVAVDKKTVSIAPVKNIAIQFIEADIERLSFRPGELDGILMANSFHYIKEKSRLIQGMRSYLKTGGRMLIVEYDRVTSNRWVPFPISYPELERLFKSNGFGSVVKIGEKNSVFGPNKMYASIITL